MASQTALMHMFKFLPQFFKNLRTSKQSYKGNTDGHFLSLIHSLQSHMTDTSYFISILTVIQLLVAKDIKNLKAKYNYY